MSNSTTKSDLLKSASNRFNDLVSIVESIGESEQSTPFDFSNDESRKELHWSRDKNIRDVYTHLFEWHQLFLQWVRSNLKGDKQSYLPNPYTWENYESFNIEIWKKYQHISLNKSKEMIIQSHNEVLTLLETFNDAQLFSKGVYSWVEGNHLGGSFDAVTISHYEWALEKIKAHCKNLQK